MKRTLLFFLLISSGCILAQTPITLTSSDIAGVNKIIYQATDIHITGNAIIGFTGPSQVWNMTSLAEDEKDTLTFLAYSSAPNVQLSGANLLLKQGYENNYIYAVNSPGSLTALGFAGYFGSSPVTQKNTPAEILSDFPATYNTGFTNNYVSNAKIFYGQTVTISGVPIYIDSIRVKSNVHKTVLRDAWGNITTPFAGGPYAVLRIKETKVTYDTTDAFFLGAWVDAINTKADSTTTYAWWAKNVGFPIATATMDSTGGVSKIEWLKSTGTVGVSENAVRVPDVSVFPNPAQYQVNFVIDVLKASSVRVYDVTGRFINEYVVKNNRSTINTSHYVNGIYSYTVIGEEDTILKHGKFAVSK